MSHNYNSFQYKEPQNIQLSRILHFKDKALNHEFVLQYDKEQRSFYKLGVWMSLISWFALISMTALFQTEGIIYLIAPVFIQSLFLIFLLFAFRKDKFLGHYQWMVTLANALAIFINMNYFFFIFKPLWPLPTLLGFIFLMIFGVVLLRMRLLYTIIALPVYLIYFLIILSIGKLNLEIRTIYMFSSILITTILLMTSYFSERASQIIFLQKRIIKQEHQRSENLLLNILPEPITKRLKEDEKTIADAFDSVSILFADIVNFTVFAEKLSPQELVHTLDEIFTDFDKLSKKYNLEKIKTIGDAYMVVGGVPIPGESHKTRILEMAIEMQNLMKEKYMQQNINLRIGIACGPAVAGVIGRSKFSYDIWGDTVNIASRMESHGIPGRIQVTEAVYNNNKDNYTFESRGEIDIKGKGKMKTWILNA